MISLTVEVVAAFTIGYGLFAGFVAWYSFSWGHAEGRNEGYEEALAALKKKPRQHTNSANQSTPASTTYTPG